MVKPNLMLRPNYNTMAIDRNSGINKMNVHCDKTYCFLLGMRHSTQSSQEMNIYINGNKIKNVTKQKLLSIYIDEICSLALKM